MSATAPPPPRVMFGPYRLDGLLGHGPSASVYRAVDSSHGNRVVALKVFSPQLSADAGFRERLRRDASVLGALREPHIVPIHRYGEIDDLAYLDMRLVRGPTLEEALRHGALDPARAAAVAEQVGSALAAMVRAGLGHRPVHASEVLLTGSPDRGEFVQLVGLGLGRPPVSPGDAASDALLARGATPRPSRRDRRRLLLAAAAAVAVLGTGLAVALVGPPGSAGADAPAGPVERPALMATISTHPGMIIDADTAELDGRPVVVAAAGDGSIHTWDLGTGEAVRPSIPGTANGVEAGTLDGRAVVVARTADGSMAIHDLDDGSPITAPAGPGELPAEGAMEGTTVDGLPALVAPRHTGAVLPAGSVRPGSPQVGMQLLALPGGEPLGPLLADEGRSIYIYSVVAVEGRPALVTLDATGRVVARDLRTGAAVGVATPPQPARPIGLTTTVLDGTPVAVTGGADNALRVWNLLTGEQVGRPLVGHTKAVTLLNTVRVGGRDVLVSSTVGLTPPDEAETAFWDLTDLFDSSKASTPSARAPLAPPLIGHPTAVVWFTAAVGDRAALVARTPDGAFTVWDAAVVAGMEPS